MTEVEKSKAEMRSAWEEEELDPYREDLTDDNNWKRKNIFNLRNHASQAQLYTRLVPEKAKNKVKQPDDNLASQQILVQKSKKPLKVVKLKQNSIPQIQDNRGLAQERRGESELIERAPKTINALYDNSQLEQFLAKIKQKD